jgi:hypothetical protein
VLGDEAVEEAGLGGDLQQQVGQVGVGEAPVDLLAQREQAGRFGQCIELRDGETSGGELMDRVVGVQALAGAAVGRVELGAEPLDERLGRTVTGRRQSATRSRWARRAGWRAGRRSVRCGRRRRRGGAGRRAAPSSAHM